MRYRVAAVADGWRVVTRAGASWRRLTSEWIRPLTAPSLRYRSGRLPSSAAHPWC
jgi:hypothetical protein